MPTFCSYSGSDILLDPWTYVFYNASYSHNGGPGIQQPGNYSTDTIRDYGLGYLDNALKHPKSPFFVGSEWALPSLNKKAYFVLTFLT